MTSSPPKFQQQRQNGSLVDASDVFVGKTDELQYFEGVISKVLKFNGKSWRCVTKNIITIVG